MTDKRITWKRISKIVENLRLKAAKQAMLNVAGVEDDFFP